MLIMSLGPAPGTEPSPAPGGGVVGGLGSEYEDQDGSGLRGRAYPASSSEADTTNHLTEDGLALLFYSRRGGQLS